MLRWTLKSGVACVLGYMLAQVGCPAVDFKGISKPALTFY